MTIFLPDLVRLVGLVLCALVLGAYYVVMRTNQKAAKARRRDNVRGGAGGQATPRRAWLPEHVWRVALGTLLLVFGTGIDMATRLGEPIAWHAAPTYIVGYVFLIVGLRFMVLHLRARDS